MFKIIGILFITLTLLGCENRELYEDGSVPKNPSKSTENVISNSDNSENSLQKQLYLIDTEEKISTLDSSGRIKIPSSVVYSGVDHLELRDIKFYEKPMPFTDAGMLLISTEANIPFSSYFLLEGKIIQGLLIKQEMLESNLKELTQENFSLAGLRSDGSRSSNSSRRNKAQDDNSSRNPREVSAKTNDVRNSSNFSSKDLNSARNINESIRVDSEKLNNLETRASDVRESLVSSSDISREEAENLRDGTATSRRNVLQRLLPKITSGQFRDTAAIGIFLAIAASIFTILHVESTKIRASAVEDSLQLVDSKSSLPISAMFISQPTTAYLYHFDLIDNKEIPLIVGEVTLSGVVSGFLKPTLD